MNKYNLHTEQGKPLFYDDKDGNLLQGQLIYGNNTVISLDKKRK